VNVIPHLKTKGIALQEQLEVGVASQHGMIDCLLQKELQGYPSGSDETFLKPICFQPKRKKKKTPMRKRPTDVKRKFKGWAEKRDY
jgi:hypothetical protein